MKKVASADGTSIAFEKVGDGAPVILVGGAFCDHRSRPAGLPLADALAAKFSVYSYDRRGRGESTDTPPYSVAREVEDLGALLAAVGGSAHVYGHSSGAVLAFEAAHAGLPIQKLALYEPPLVLEGRAPVPKDLVQQLRALSAAGKRAETAELFLTRAVGVPAEVVARRKTTPAWPFLEALAHTLSYDATLTADAPALLARAASVTTPTLLLDGERSEPWLRSGVDKFARALPNATHSTLAAQTHDVDPLALGPVLLAFFGA
ncbi:MAG TPA: alpha/beta hydrolase [Polyangiaceae bacterium]